MNETVMRRATLLVVYVGLAVSTIAQSSAKGHVGLAVEDAPGSGGAVVGMVMPGRPAAQEGLKPGDIIVAINGAAVDGAATMTRMIGAIAPNQTARLSVIRAGGSSSQRLTISVVIGSLGGSTGTARAASSPSTPASRLPAATPSTATAP